MNRYRVQFADEAVIIEHAECIGAAITEARLARHKLAFVMSRPITDEQTEVIKAEREDEYRMGDKAKCYVGTTKERIVKG